MLQRHSSFFATSPVVFSLPRKSRKKTLYSFRDLRGHSSREAVVAQGMHTGVFTKWRRRHVARSRLVFVRRRSSAKRNTKRSSIVLSRISMTIFNINNSNIQSSSDRRLCFVFKFSNLLGWLLQND
ncbi:hypothetical protein K0M31_001959 [Melipona bicolor]|uniref:Uncharacterized protein n=1 Tax=Melipona bicolor TaxID=60889 RepID=A0AA40KY38_9HYME|nr:hypothetical protein K0M31_001959 [Melipona bicolor]